MEVTASNRIKYKLQIAHIIPYLSFRVAHEFAYRLLLLLPPYCRYVCKCVQITKARRGHDRAYIRGDNACYPTYARLRFKR